MKKKLNFEKNKNEILSLDFSQMNENKNLLELVEDYIIETKKSESGNSNSYHKERFNSAEDELFNVVETFVRSDFKIKSINTKLKQSKLQKNNSPYFYSVKNENENKSNFFSSKKNKNKLFKESSDGKYF